MRFPQDILSELRRQGFKREWLSRGGGTTVVCYQKIVGDRKLDLQLWADGGHRISHYHTALTLHGCMCTTPTDFRTLAQMKEAIKTELTRNDHKAD